MQAVLIYDKYAAETIDTARFSVPIYCPDAQYLSYMVVASAQSSNTGTTITIQGSHDGVSFASLVTVVAVTVAGNYTVNLAALFPSYAFYRLAYARTSGSYVATTTVMAKGPAT